MSVVWGLRGLVGGGASEDLAVDSEIDLGRGCFRAGIRLAGFPGIRKSGTGGVCRIRAQACSVSRTRGLWRFAE